MKKIVISKNLLNKIYRTTQMRKTVKRLKKSIEMKKIVISKNMLNKIYRTTQMRKTVKKKQNINY